MLGHVFSEILNQGDLLFQLLGIVSLFAHRFHIFFIEVGKLLSILMENNASGIVIQYPNRIV